jgi:osmoprotectant transport system permease protein
MLCGGRGFGRGGGHATVPFVAANPWFSWSYITQHASELLSATRQHVALTVWSVLVATCIAVPMAVVARRWGWSRGTILTGVGILYTIPSLALISVLQAYFGLRPITVEIALVGYALLIIVRNTLIGLDGVPAEVREAALGMGFGPTRLLTRVEIPLALPSIMAGIRVATVSTIALVTVGAIVGNGGLGGLILEGLNNLYRAEIMAAALGCVLLAFIADLLLLGLQRLVTPWTRRRAG